MKKTLIALATVAVAGAASAQVTLSGKLAYGWETASNPAGVTTSKGLKVTDGNFTLAATEDLGGGLKMAAKMDIQSRGRGTDIAGRDASLTLTGGFGALTIGAVEAANGILDLGGAGAPVIGLDDNNPVLIGTVTAATQNKAVLDSATNVDVLAYALPVGNGLTLTVKRTDANKTGEGSNPGTTYGAEYAAGALSAKLDRTSAALVKRTRVSASYDLGMATIGYGYQTVKATTDGLASVGAGTNKQTLVGVAVPMDAWTFGVNYGTNKNTTTGLDNKGTDLGVSYALSKRTTFYVQNQRVKVGTNAASKTTRVKLMHTF
ncbi:porin [Comamonadaceae bacterium M7527]|nr:porin [Comamonadaceae bacterium M7527]